VRFAGVRYRIDANGTVTPERPVDVNFAEPAAPVSAELAADVRKAATLARRRRSRKARHEALTGLGLVRVRGALGGVYYE